MAVDFKLIRKDALYSRRQLAELWGYAGPQALARGVVTPRGQHKIILFVTQEKQASQKPYQDRLEGNVLEWEGPTDHFAEERMINAEHTGDEIHVFFRDRHHRPFVYLGQAEVIHVSRFIKRPSRFRLRLISISNGDRDRPNGSA